MGLNEFVRARKKVGRAGKTITSGILKALQKGGGNQIGFNNPVPNPPPFAGITIGGLAVKGGITAVILNAIAEPTASDGRDAVEPWNREVGRKDVLEEPETLIEGGQDPNAEYYLMAYWQGQDDEGNVYNFSYKLVSNYNDINWQAEQGLSIFFLPPYSPEMNRIEEQWCRAANAIAFSASEAGQMLRIALMSSSSTIGGSPNRAIERQELGGRVFEDEYDLALAIIDGIANRGRQGNYSVERLVFN